MNSVNRSRFAFVGGIFVCVFVVSGCTKLEPSTTSTTGSTPTTNTGDAAPPPPSSTTVPTSYKLTAMVAQNAVSNPTDIAFVPGSSGAFLVTGQSGTVYYFDGSTTPVNTQNIASSIGIVDGGEQGLLNIEFHPDYASNNYVLFYHTSITQTVNSISRMTLSFNNGNMALSNAVKILDMRKAASAAAGNHNGGGMVFAPDKTLLVSVGDGGSDSTTAQNTKKLLGKVLRIDPSLAAGTGGYTIPSGNRFAASNAICSDVVTSATDCPEILAMGLRNPFRMSIDSNMVYIGDVGSGTEEINSFDYSSSSFVNFGWPTHDGPVASSSISGYKNPILSYQRNDSTAARFRSEDPNGRNSTYASIIIGDVVRSTKYGGALDGRLLHGEFMDGFIRGQAITSAGSTTGNGLHLAHHDGLAAMVQGTDGFVYIATQGGSWGTTGPDLIYRLDPGP